MITSVHSHIIFDWFQDLLERLDIDDQFSPNDMASGLHVGEKWIEGDPGEYLGTFLTLKLRKTAEGERKFAKLEIPIDYRVTGEGTAYEQWLAKRNK